MHFLTSYDIGAATSIKKTFLLAKSKVRIAPGKTYSRPDYEPFQWGMNRKM